MELSRKDKERIKKTYAYRCNECNSTEDVTHSIRYFETFNIFCSKCDMIMRRAIVAPSLIGFDNLGRSK